MRVAELINNLTKREEEIAELVAKGKSNKGIAIELNKKASSIRTCLKSIYSKLFIDDDERINKRVILSLMVKEEKELGINNKANLKLPKELPIPNKEEG